MRPSRKDDLTSIILLQLLDAFLRKVIVLLSERRLSLATSAARGGIGLALGPCVTRPETGVQGANAAITHAE